MPCTNTWRPIGRLVADLLLAGGQVALVDDDALPLAGQHSWYYHRTQRLNYVKFYVAGYLGNGRKEYLHRFIMNPPKGYRVDHINGDSLDNRRKNLRLVDRSTNGHNRHSFVGVQNGCKGVRFCPRSPNNPWSARICVRGVQMYLGSFPTRELAVAARKAAELEHYGETFPQPEDFTEPHHAS